MFYRAYERSAYLLCRLVHPFKVSCHFLKTVNDNIVSVGFPQTSLEKWKGERDVSSFPGGVILGVTEVETGLLADFPLWKESFRQETVNAEPDRGGALRVYGDVYRLTVELCRMCANLDRAYRYSLGEQVRGTAMKMLLDIDSNLNSVNLESVFRARRKLAEIQLCLRLLSDLNAISKGCHLSFVELTDNISKQLVSWERSLRSRKAPEC